MELLITYSPSGKTKYFNVLLESGEILAARTKKAALYILQTLQEKLNVRKNQVTDDDLQETVADHPEPDTYNDIFGSVPKSSRKRARSGVQEKRSKHSTPLHYVRDSKERIERMVASIHRSGVEAEQHRINAEQHRINAEQHQKNAEEIERMRLDFVSESSEFDRYFGDSIEGQVSQQFDDERPMRRIVQVDLDHCADHDRRDSGLLRLAGSGFGDSLDF